MLAIQGSTVQTFWNELDYRVDVYSVRLRLQGKRIIVILHV